MNALRRTVQIVAACLFFGVGLTLGGELQAVLWFMAGASFLGAMD
jgi:hypothetical protein